MSRVKRGFPTTELPLSVVFQVSIAQQHQQARHDTTPKPCADSHHSGGATGGRAACAPMGVVMTGLTGLSGLWVAEGHHQAIAQCNNTETTLHKGGAPSSPCPRHAPKPMRKNPTHARGARARARLADVDGWVERVADVHGQVGAQQVPVAGQRVQLDLARRGAVAEVVEGLGAAEACGAARRSSAPRERARLDRARVRFMRMAALALTARCFWHMRCAMHVM